MDARQYILRAMIATVVVIVSVVAVNAFVDPYGITNSPRLIGFNEHKVDINLHARLLKKYQPMFSIYDTLIVGKSRVEMALDPEHACLSDNGQSVYNLGVPGADLTTQIAYSLNAIYQQNIREIFLSVDVTDFIGTNPKRPRFAGKFFDEGEADLRFLPSGKENTAYWKFVIRDYARALFSVDALFSSVMTVVTQSEGAADRTVAGFNPGRDFHAMVAVEGAHTLFEQKLQGLEKKYGRPWYFRSSTGELPEQFALLDRYLDILRARGIRVHLFTSPLHEGFWDLMSRHGHMQYHEDWLNELTARLRAREDDGISLWDFSGDSVYIHETVPPAKDRSGPLQWFWEPSHYRRELGDLMLDTMLSDSCQSPLHFGKQLL